MQGETSDSAAPSDLCPSCRFHTQRGHNDGSSEPFRFISNDSFPLFQDQLSADMYSFVAKEIDYANYFQTVSALALIRYRAFTGFDETVTCFRLVSPFLADRNAGRISQEVIRNPSQHPAPDQSPPR